MIAYEYFCESCGRQFEFRQAITEKPIDTCPECQGKLSLLVTGGSGFMIKGGGNEVLEKRKNGCSFESTGKTCCGQEQRCGKPPCGI